MTKFIKNHKKEILLTLGGIALAGIGGAIGYRICRHVDIKTIYDNGFEGIMAMSIRNQTAIEDVSANCTLGDMGEYGKELIKQFGKNDITELSDTTRIKEVALFID